MIINNDMYFNELTKRYYLTEEYVYNQGIDLSLHTIDEMDTNMSTLNKRVIETACDLLYDFIEDNAYDSLSAKYLIAVNPRVNNKMKKAMLYQLMTFVIKGNVSIEDDTQFFKALDKRAIKVLKSEGVFTTLIDNIPEEW